jgi:hypothetical protein
MGTDLFAGGSFTSAGGVANTAYIACWSTTNTTWSAMGSGMSSGQVNALAILGTDLYAGGLFSVTGVANAFQIARWNTTNSTWSALGSGISGMVYALTAVGTDLYAAGDVTNAGGVSVNRIARWNTTNSTWLAMGAGMTTRVNALGAYGGQVVAGAGSSIHQPRTVAANAFDFSAATDAAGSGDLRLAYTDSAGAIMSKSFTSGSWSAAATVQSSGAGVPPILSAGTGSNQYYGLWYRSGALEYKYFNGTSWDASPTVLVSASTASRFANCDAYADGGIIKCIYTTGTAAPFSVSSAVITP